MSEKRAQTWEFADQATSLLLSMEVDLKHLELIAHRPISPFELGAENRVKELQNGSFVDRFLGQVTGETRRAKRELHEQTLARPESDLLALARTLREGKDLPEHWHAGLRANANEVRQKVCRIQDSFVKCSKLVLRELRTEFPHLEAPTDAKEKFIIEIPETFDIQAPLPQFGASLWVADTRAAKQVVATDPASISLARVEEALPHFERIVANLIVADLARVSPAHPAMLSTASDSLHGDLIRNVRKAMYASVKCDTFPLLCARDPKQGNSSVNGRGVGFVVEELTTYKTGQGPSRTIARVRPAVGIGSLLVPNPNECRWVDFRRFTEFLEGRGCSDLSIQKVVPVPGTNGYLDSSGMFRRMAESWSSAAELRDVQHRVQNQMKQREDFYKDDPAAAFGEIPAMVDGAVFRAQSKNADVGANLA